MSKSKKPKKAPLKDMSDLPLPLTIGALKVSIAGLPDNTELYYAKDIAIGSMMRSYDEATKKHKFFLLHDMEQALAITQRNKAKP